MGAGSGGGCWLVGAVSGGVCRIGGCCQRWWVLGWWVLSVVVGACIRLNFNNPASVAGEQPPACRGVGVASTWSLKRVHNMTNDVLNAFHARLRDLTPMPQPPALLKKASTLAPAVAGQPEVPETPHERHRRMVRSYPLELISVRMVPAGAGGCCTF